MNPSASSGCTTSWRLTRPAIGNNRPIALRLRFKTSTSPMPATAEAPRSLRYRSRRVPSKVKSGLFSRNLTTSSRPANAVEGAAASRAARNGVGNDSSTISVGHWRNVPRVLGPFSQECRAIPAPSAPRMISSQAARSSLTRPRVPCGLCLFLS